MARRKYGKKVAHYKILDWQLMNQNMKNNNSSVLFKKGVSVSEMFLKILIKLCFLRVSFIQSPSRY